MRVFAERFPDSHSSRIVHTSVDKIAPETDADQAGAQDEDEAEDEEADQGENAEEELPDNHERSIKNTRRGTPADGLLTCDELTQLAQKLLNGQPVVSAYAAGAWETRMDPSKVETFGGRRDTAVDGNEEKPGDKEPAWTCFTPLWRLTLGKVNSLRPLTRRLRLLAAFARRSCAILDGSAPSRASDRGRSRTWSSSERNLCE